MCNFQDLRIFDRTEQKVSSEFMGEKKILFRESSRDFIALIVSCTDNLRTCRYREDRDW